MTNFDIKIVAYPSMSQHQFITLAKNLSIKRSLNRIFNEIHQKDRVYLLTVNGIECVFWNMYGSLDDIKWSWWYAPFNEINSHGDFDEIYSKNIQARIQAEKIVKDYENRKLTDKGKELGDLYDNL